MLLTRYCVHPNGTPPAPPDSNGYVVGLPSLTKSPAVLARTSHLIPPSCQLTIRRRVRKCVRTRVARYTLAGRLPHSRSTRRRLSLRHQIRPLRFRLPVHPLPVPLRQSTQA